MRPREVLATAAHEVVEHDDLLRAGLHQLVGDVGADRPTTACDQCAFTDASCEHLMLTQRSNEAGFSTRN